MNIVYWSYRHPNIKKKVGPAGGLGDLGPQNGQKCPFFRCFWIFGAQGGPGRVWKPQKWTRHVQEPLFWPLTRLCKPSGRKTGAPPFRVIFGHFLKDFLVILGGNRQFGPLKHRGLFDMSIRRFWHAASSFFGFSDWSEPFLTQESKMANWPPRGTKLTHFSNWIFFDFFSTMGDICH